MEPGEFDDRFVIWTGRRKKDDRVPCCAAEGLVREAFEFQRESVVHSYGWMERAALLLGVDYHNPDRDGEP